jgi:hypothetical protein
MAADRREELIAKAHARWDPARLAAAFARWSGLCPRCHHYRNGRLFPEQVRSLLPALTLAENCGIRGWLVSAAVSTVCLGDRMKAPSKHREAPSVGTPTNAPETFALRESATWA